MTQQLIPYAVIWALLTLVIVGLALYRKTIAVQEDDTLHIREDEVQLVASQGALAHKLGSIDKLGKVLTVLAFVYGIALASLFVYWSWVEKNASSVNLQVIR